MRSYELSTWYSTRDRDGTGTRYQATKGYRVTLYTQPWYRYVWAKLYHRYDMAVLKIPGALRLERWVDRIRYAVSRTARENEIPWFCMQDLRCFDLHQRGRKELATFDITEEQFELLGGTVYNAWRQVR